MKRRATTDEIHVYQEFIERPVDVAANLVKSIGAGSADRNRGEPPSGG